MERLAEAKIIPRMSRDCCQPLPEERTADGLRGPRPLLGRDVGGGIWMLVRRSGMVWEGVS